MRIIQQAGGIIVSPKGKVLLVINGGTGSHTFPKGAVESQESLLDTARREIQEETGLQQITIYQELGSVQRPGYTADNTATPSVIKHIHLFLCTAPETLPVPQVTDIQGAEWVSIDKVAEVLTYPEEAAFFAHHRDKLNP